MIHTGSGYIQKQNEVVEICKMCKYRKMYIEQRDKANSCNDLTEKDDAIKRIKDEIYSNAEGLEMLEITFYSQGIEDLKTILELIQKQQVELKRLDKEAQQYFETTVIQSEQYSKEIEKKDKIIDEMANNIASSDSDLCQYIDETIRCKKYARENKLTCDKCIKQYFIEKVEE